jgi:hypothetical protein
MLTKLSRGQPFNVDIQEFPSRKNEALDEGIEGAVDDRAGSAVKAGRERPES